MLRLWSLFKTGELGEPMKNTFNQGGELGGGEMWQIGRYMYQETHLAHEGEVPMAGREVYVSETSLDA